MIMKNKGIKYIIAALMAGILIYNSVYFRPLDVKLAEGKEEAFDAKSFVDGIWESDLLEIYDSAMDITKLIELLRNDHMTTFAQEAQALGIGNIGYFKVKGEGLVQSVNENNVLLQIGELIIELETEFIFGNAVRDASGLVKINDFDETSDFNTISESINEKIRKEIIPNFRAKVEKGDKVVFKGALELNKAHLNLDKPEVIPVSIQISL